MAWIFLIDGFSIKVSGLVDAYETREFLTENMEFKLLEQYAVEHGSVLLTAVDTEEESLSIISGKEMYEDRHIYKGQTECVKVSKTQEDLNVQYYLEDRIINLLDKLSIKHNDSVHGTVISQFD